MRLPSRLDYQQTMARQRWLVRAPCLRPAVTVLWAVTILLCTMATARADDCPFDAGKTEPGQCGCGNPDTDSDSDGIADCLDMCPNYDDATDTNNDGVTDGCLCDAGYWAPSPTQQCTACPLRSNCLARSVCAANSGGPLCSSCPMGFFVDNVEGTCTPCERYWWVPEATGVLIALLAMWVVSRGFAGEPSLAALWQLAWYTQTVAAVLAIKVDWPKLVRRGARYGRYVFADVSLVAPECELSMSWHTKLSASLAAYGVLLAIAFVLPACLYCLAAVLSRRQAKRLAWAGAGVRITPRTITRQTRAVIPLSQVRTHRPPSTRLEPVRHNDGETPAPSAKDVRAAVALRGAATLNMAPLWPAAKDVKHMARNGTTSSSTGRMPRGLPPLVLGKPHRGRKKGMLSPLALKAMTNPIAHHGDSSTAAAEALRSPSVASRHSSRRVSPQRERGLTPDVEAGSLRSVNSEVKAPGPATPSKGARFKSVADAALAVPTVPLTDHEIVGRRGSRWAERLIAWRCVRHADLAPSPPTLWLTVWACRRCVPCCAGDPSGVSA